MNFTHFKNAVARQFERMTKHPMFRSKVEKDMLWTMYLHSFPEGTNPIFRERTEHDCACCKQFIRAVGDVIAIIDGKVVSVWDIQVPEEPGYEVVAKAMSRLVSGYGIDAPFLHYERTAGVDKNFEQVLEGGTNGVRQWNHFFVNIPTEFVKSAAEIPTLLGDARSTFGVFRRSLETITGEALSIVSDLIAQKSLYKGEEHEHTVNEFMRLHNEFKALPPDTDNSTYLWTAYKTASAPVARLRNISIGTLLVDLSEGKDLESAVKAFETMVAGTNYKRPTALVTKGMIESAKKTIEELGLTSALERRYATLADINVNNVLWADRSARKAMGDIYDVLAAEVKAKVPKSDKVEEVPIDRFIADILPRVDTLEVLVTNAHAGNFVSLLTAADPTAQRLFKWDNQFSWSYRGELADSIKERVKLAGGNVEGDLCCRLGWYNFDDLDFHMNEPQGGHISFMEKHSRRTGGRLDVDMNAGSGHTREPVENIFYGERRQMLEGMYTLSVNQFRARETSNVGFEVEIDYLGTMHRFVYTKRVHGTVQVAKFRYTHKDGLVITESLPETEGGNSRKLWGVPTLTYSKVNAMMMSPNFWDDKGVGHRHYFFMLDGCANDETTRGFYNEFLRSDLDKHRKVFEMIGSKVKPAPAKEQLSGLGFSSTQRNTLTVRVKGSYSRVLKLVF